MHRQQIDNFFNKTGPSFGVRNQGAICVQMCTQISGLSTWKEEAKAASWEVSPLCNTNQNETQTVLNGASDPATGI